MYVTDRAFVQSPFNFNKTTCLFQTLTISCVPDVHVEFILWICEMLHLAHQVRFDRFSSKTCKIGGRVSVVGKLVYVVTSLMYSDASDPHYCKRMNIDLYSELETVQLLTSRTEK